MNRRIATALLAACLLTSVACLVYPLYVIRPFRAQGPRELAAALAVMQSRLWITSLSAVVAVAVLALAFFHFRTRVGIWAAMAVTAAVLLCVPLCQVNVYELMFYPDARPSFSQARGAKLDGDELVLAVKRGGEARSYPVRSISYHHIINDKLAGTPLVATY